MTLKGYIKEVAPWVILLIVVAVLLVELT